MTENHPEDEIKNPPAIQYPALPWLAALAIMILFDQLTWEKQFGLQFLILTVLVLTAMFALAAAEKKRIPWPSYLLLAPILLGGVMTALRTASSTTAFNILLVLAGFALLALTLLNGQWSLLRLREVLLGGLTLIQSALIDPVRVLIERAKHPATSPDSQKPHPWRRVWPYLRGVLIALPVLLVLGGLLASADMIFRQNLGGLLSWFRIENLIDAIFRAVYILIFAYLMAGVFIHALTRGAEAKALSEDQPFFKPFLGHTEAFIVLALVNLLFLGFIVVQFRYFFAGEANITIEGFTYAEYARRGFFELVAVAIISLGLYYLLSMFTQRASRTTRVVFSVLGVLLMLQVGIMLISAFQRLSLYEAAYGFTTLRTVAHVFMVWLGVLLAAVTLMEVFNQFKRLAFTLFMIVFGFTLTLNLLNVDRFIATQNIAHAAAGHPLDASYLMWNLSNDGIPALFEAWTAPDTPEDVKESLEGVLACKFALRKQRPARDFWAERHFSASRADALFAAHQQTLKAYPFIEKIEYYEDLNPEQAIDQAYRSNFIVVDGEEIWCKTAQGD